MAYRGDRSYRYSGDEVQLARLRRGWSAKELARRAAVSAATISRFERGKTQVTPDTMGKIASAFGRRLESFVEESGA